MARQEYDKNVIQVKGTTAKVYRRNGDVFALLTVRGEIGKRSKTLVRIKDGMIDSQPVSLKNGNQIQVMGYLEPEEYAISLMSFLQISNSLQYADLIPAEDLPEWVDLVIFYNNPVLKAQSIAVLNNDNKVVKEYGKGCDPKYDNYVLLEGIVVHEWNYPPKADGDNYVRLAVYDQYCEPEPGNSMRGKLPRQQAHYINVRIPDDEKGVVSLKQRLFLSGTYEQSSQRLTLLKALDHTNKNGNLQRLLDRLPQKDWLEKPVLMRRVNFVNAKTLTLYDK